LPIPKSVARFNRIVTNNVTGPLASRLPWFGVVIHKGRVSGKTYRTPVNCWIDEGSAIIALTYGPGTDWLRNLAKSQGGALEHRGARYEVGEPELIGPVGMDRMPALVRPALRLLEVDRFAVLPLLSPARPI
jgi:hypothetical protein